MPKIVTTTIGLNYSAELLDKVNNLVHTFESNISFYKKPSEHYNETSCRNEFLDPFLGLLGWDISNAKGLPPQYREVIVENFSAITDKPDYSMTLRGITKFFVEAKKPSVDISLDKAPAYQAKRYGWNANHKLVVLSNFEYLFVYDSSYVPIISDEVSVALIRKYHCSEYEKCFSEIYDLISKEAVYSGCFDKMVAASASLKNNRIPQPVDQHFLSQINMWRLELSNYLYNIDPKFKSIDVLNETVQQFINQIVFLRICEDKNLPLYHNLLENTKDPITLKSEINKMIQNADKRYNSGLFSGNIVFDLDNEIISKIINTLYFPQSPYLFNIIEPGLLGKIYEIFLTEQLAIVSGKIILQQKKDCLDRSVVTTPSEIVKYMVDYSLSKLCESRDPMQILDLRIADIACGSGLFLVEAFDYLCGYCLDWFIQYKPGFLGTNLNALPLSFKKRILTSCLYGIDIDIHAVEVAKFSLLIKLIEAETEPSVHDENPILTSLDENILWGNSLVEPEDIKKYIGSLSIDEELQVRPFSWELINKGEKFDLILGNPPYVKTEDMKNLLPENEMSIYSKKYISSYKQYDKYFLFVERAINGVEDEGFVCVIIPNKFFKIGAGTKLRKIIADSNLLWSMVDFGSTQLFDDKTIYSSIIFLWKFGNNNFIFQEATSPAQLWAGTTKNSLSISSKQLGEKPWILTTDEDFLKALDKVKGVSVPIMTHVEIYNGIQTSAERPEPIYWFSDDEVESETADTVIVGRDGKKYEFEKDILKPYFKPVKKDEKGLNTYSLLETDKHIIFPYDTNGKLYSESKMKTRFKGAYKYLMDNYDRLVPKNISPNGIRDVQYATSETWYQYGRTQSLTAFINQPKLIVGIMSRDPLYLYDDSDMLIASGGTAGYCAISMKDDSPYDLLYIQAWLTNHYTEQLLSIIGSDFEGDFFSRGTAVLKEVPFLELNFSDPVQQLLHDDVVQKSKEIIDLNTKLSYSTTKAKKTIIERKKAGLIREIEILIDSVYETE